MFRIEAQPFRPQAVVKTGRQAREEASAKKTAESKVFHACASTCLHALESSASGDHVDDGGALTTVGRKNCTVTFEYDKCVSRRHCRLRLVKKSRCRQDEEEGCAAAGSGRCFAPRTDEEGAACDDSDLGIAVVLDDLGSKFGTFLLEEDDNDDGESMKNKKDGSDTDDATDDEGIVAVSAISEAGRQNSQTTTEVSFMVGGKKMKRRRLDPKESVILHALSHSNAEDDSGQRGGGSVTIYAGISGSCITVTRLPTMVMCFSRDCPPSRRDALALRAHLIGACTVSTWDSKECTHLVCAKRTCTAKVIATWSLRKPIVTPDFVQASLDRSDVASPPVDEEDYLPPSSGDDAAMNSAVDPSLPRNVLKGSTLITLAGGEIEQLICAGGGEVFRSHEMKDREFANGSWLTTLQETTKGQNATVLAFVENSGKRVKKRRAYLAKQGVPCTTATKIAASMAKLEPLQDVNGKVLLPLPPPHAAGKEDVPSLAMAERAAPPSPGKTDKVSSCATASPVKEMESRDQQVAETTNDDDMDVIAKDAAGSLHENDESSPISHATPEHATKTLTGDYGSPSAGGSDRAKEEEENDDDSGYPVPKDDNNDNASGCSSRNRGRMVDEKLASQPQSDGEKRKRLPRTEDGWLLAAPAKNRGMYRSYEHSEEGFKEAVTEIVQGLLVVRPSAAKATNGVGAKHIRRRRRGRKHGANYEGSNDDRVDHDGPNFKRFKKNDVVRGVYSRDVRLVATLPKESERQRQLELTQLAIEKEERMADALFAGAQDRGGSIKSFFKPTPKRRAGGGRRRR